MKKILFILTITLGTLVSAQKYSGKSNERHYDEKKKSYIHDFEKMNHDEKMVFIQQLNINKIIKELKLSGEKKDAMDKLLNEYFTTKGEILKSFKPEEINENMTDEDAMKKIDLGFDIAQKILDTRKQYSKKFLEHLSPKQVLKIYKIEKEIRESFKHTVKDKCKNK